jgi:hypothetical protein
MDMIPVGVRGSQRHERRAGFTRLSEVMGTRRPDQGQTQLLHTVRGVGYTLRGASVNKATWTESTPTETRVPPRGDFESSYLPA